MKEVSEAQLAAAFAGLLKRTQSRVGLPRLRVLLSEFEALQGRADYVGAATIPGLRQAAVAGWGDALTHPATAAVYGETRRRARTVETLAERTGLAIRTVRGCVRKLAQTGLVSITSAGVMRAAARLPTPDLWAFELKVSDWRRALFQATQYQAFAHRVAVVLASEYAHRAAPHVALFRKLGIGLLVLDDVHSSPRLRRLAAPKRRRPSSGTYHLHALGRLIASAPAAE